jgi:hypothetical protein
MKKTLLFLAVFLSMASGSFSQAEFNTGTLELVVNEYGRIRLFSEDGTRQLQRASILAGTSITSVFDYPNDAETLEPTVLVADPQLSDFEIYGAYDNSYSGLPPAVEVRLHAYGWTGGEFVIVKFNVKNIETAAMNPLIGLDIIPELNQTYGFDTVTYLENEQVIRFHRGAGINMGMKLLSAPLSTVVSTEWFEDYSVDENYWNWMNFNALQPLYVSTTADGPVTITSQEAVEIAPNESTDVYYAMALGADQQDMLDNIAAANAKYLSWFASVDDPNTPQSLVALEQNYPNPFQNSTSIRYTLPEDGPVSLTIYNSAGNEVANLVNVDQTAGTHVVEFGAERLPPGIYFCRLLSGNNTSAIKLQIVK